MPLDITRGLAEIDPTVPSNIPRQGPRVWLLCTLLFFATALCFLDRQVLSVLAPQITEEFGMSNTVYSRVVFAFVLSYTVMTSLGGRLMDALGTRLGLGLAVGFWTVASAAHAFVIGPITLGVARFFLGVGEGPCFPAATKGVMEWVDKKNRALAIGFANGGSAVGAIVAPPLTVWVATVYGWRGAFAVTAVLGLIWVIAWWVFVPKPPKRSAAVRAPAVRFRDLLARPEVRRLIPARFFFDPVFYFYLFWIPQYLARERGMSLADIGKWFWIPWLALEISNLGAGYCSDRLVRRGWAPRRARLTLMLFAALLTPASGLAVGAETPAVAIGLMSVLLFAHGIWIGNFITHLGESVGSHEVATTVGLTGTCGGIAGMLSNLVIGPVVDHFSFTPIFMATAVVYPVAWIILRGRTPLNEK